MHIFCNIKDEEKMETRERPHRGFHRVIEKLDKQLSLILMPFASNECVRCNKRALSYPLCEQCKALLLSDLEASENHRRCRVCGRLLVSEIDLCSYCRSGAVLKHTDGVLALLSYQFWKKDLMFAWKSLENRTLVSVFASIMNRELERFFQTIGHRVPVVPVPPRRGKIRRQGWDQIEDLSRVLEKAYGHCLLRLLRRSTFIQQKKLDRRQRLEQNETAWHLAGEKRRKRLFSKIPEEVILIDDVLTTGSTLEHCARVLKGAGIKKVYGMTLFFA